MRFFPLFFGFVHENCLIFGLSTYGRLRPQESCSYVRTYVTLFLGNRSLLFSETLQLVRACKRKKNFRSAFFVRSLVSEVEKGHFHIFQENSKCPFLAKIYQNLAIRPKNFQNWPYWPKIGGFAFLSKFIHQNFLIFCFNSSLWSQK